MKHSKRLSFLSGFLNVAIVAIVLLLFAFSSIFFGQDKTERNIVSLIGTLLLFVGYIVIIMYLKNILGSIRHKDPFNLKNVGYFQNIGYIIFAIGIIEIIGNYTTSSGIVIIGTASGGIKPLFFLYLVLSTLAFVLSDVFRMAIEIKKENDLTV